MAERLPVKIVDGLRLDDRYRQALRPGEMTPDRDGRMRRLPRFFYEVDSWKTALETQLTPRFALWEFMGTDVREAAALHGFPRYVPCAVTATAAHLELYREKVGTYIHIAANGGYRSPSHDLSRDASVHCWGTAINIYKIGDDYLDDQEKIERYAAVATALLPGLWARPYGHSLGFADDHLHLDLGYMIVVPRDAAGEESPEVNSE